VVCFVLVDRYKPQRAVVWLLALGWGACAAVAGSYYINTWAGNQMAVINEAPGLSAQRVAVFIAPFVEEAMKACVIFLVVILDRNRFASRVSGAVVGGLAGAGFAFTENIMYYAQVIVYGSYTAGAGDVMKQLDSIVLLRGVVTCFGHPLFTVMTGLGVGFAVAARSKTVRVVAPLAGFLLAAFLHMSFNFWLPQIPDSQLMIVLFVGVWPVVIMVALRLVMSAVAQGRTVAARLGDYVAMGWLPGVYPQAFSTLRRRGWTVVMSLWHANPVATWRLQRRVTELAVLREAITRGTIDQAGLVRENDLVDQLAGLVRAGALVDGRGLRPYWPWQAAQRRGRLSGSVAQTIAWQNATVNPALKYSGVDSQWGPPA
jgi:RsiW-degrading membrane proteinase PrsW (M82 family)